MANNFCAAILCGKVASEPEKVVFQTPPGKDRDQREVRFPAENAVRFYLNVARWEKGRDGQDGQWVANHLLVYVFGEAAKQIIDPVKGVKLDQRLYVEGTLDKLIWEEYDQAQGKQVKRSVPIVRCYGAKPGFSHNINRVILMGSLFRDPKVHYFERSGGCKTSMTVTHDRWVKLGEGRGQNARCFNDVTIVGNKRSEAAAQHLFDRSGVLIDGWLEVENWNDKTTQKRQSRTTIKTFDFTFAGSGRNERAASGDMPPGGSQGWGDAYGGPPDDGGWGGPPDPGYDYDEPAGGGPPAGYGEAPQMGGGAPGGVDDEIPF